jgi:hypothetical protein
VAVGARHPRALALDDEPRRIAIPLDGIVDEVRPFLVEPLGPVIHKLWQGAAARIERKPAVQELALPDRLDDGGAGALEVQDENPAMAEIGKTFAARGKFSMKMAMACQTM